ncbi:unnamed protein product [Cylindrotheca closterium]|uniref:Glycosyltransferase family 92 protein n=1 Tax=Cylindrotheca closterium TaxID=2856 RepID=A0AAD2FXR2_9STRA|nr:unnamed protein product [Cylindrotheca closterium]
MKVRIPSNKMGGKPKGSTSGAPWKLSARMLVTVSFTFLSIYLFAILMALKSADESAQPCPEAKTPFQQEIVANNAHPSSNSKPIMISKPRVSKEEAPRQDTQSYANQQKQQIAKPQPRQDSYVRKVIAPGTREFGKGVQPEQLPLAASNQQKESDIGDSTGGPPPHRRLSAYLEPIDEDFLSRNDLNTAASAPLPLRPWTSEDLIQQEFSAVKSCSRLVEQWPVDDYPDGDPFLPWIHDVFPSHDGKMIQIVAQNKRRCRTGHSKDDVEALKHFEPHIALFEHVPIQRISSTDKGEQRYRLANHENADLDGVATRFLCRFTSDKLNVDETTLSVFNFDYEWASLRKHQKVLFHDHGRDNKQVHTSQLLFQCPVPESLQEIVQKGSSVIDDYATLFLDIVPIRTPPRYGHPASFLKPYYSNSKATSGFSTPRFDLEKQWGSNHIIPKIKDSGRWTNIPICKPSLMTYQGEEEPPNVIEDPPEDKLDLGQPTTVIEKKHRLVSCLWASAGYTTRGERFAINDGQRRLFEWITYNRMLGVEHFYLYDNSGVHGPEVSLQPVADMFPPDLVTVINWPSTVCNNNPNNVDCPGERSSQYAAEASCRLRFGPHVDWIAQFDIDEYLVPMGNLTTATQLIDRLEEEGNKVISFGSWRAWPRRRFIETPNVMFGKNDCGREQRCFNLRIPMNYTMLQAYNCDRQKPGEKVQQMPAEKQIYRPDYVMHHFIHYSTVTKTSNRNMEDIENSGLKYKKWTAFPDQLQRFGNEVTEGLMLHTKAVATQDTVHWEETCKAGYEGYGTCRLGSPYPEDMSEVDESKGDDGWKYNCYVHKKVDHYFVPHLEEQLKEHIPELAAKMDQNNKKSSWNVWSL